jgi:hypothetical protein
MRRSLAPAAASVLLLAVVSAGAVSADARSRARPVNPAFRLTLPAPGHITVSTIEMKVTGKRHRALPARLRLRPQKLASLPPSVRILYAQRTLRKKRSTTYRVALLAVNVAARKAVASAPGEEPRGKDLVNLPRPNTLSMVGTLLLFMGSPVAADFMTQDEEKAELERHEALILSALTADIADMLPPANAKKVTDEVKSVLDPNGDGVVDPKLETGHYDDGHAFGWSVKTKQDEKKTWGELFNANLDQYIATLEDGFQYDIDGDGVTEKPAPAPAPVPGGAPTLDTHVGPVEITDG